MSFGKYLLAFFLPPVYLYSRGKWISGTVNLCVWLFAWLVLLLFFPLAPFVWLVSAIHALWNLRNELMFRHAQMIAQQIALAQALPRKVS